MARERTPFASSPRPRLGMILVQIDRSQRHQGLLRIPVDLITALGRGLGNDAILGKAQENGTRPRARVTCARFDMPGMMHARRSPLTFWLQTSRIVRFCLRPKPLMAASNLAALKHLLQRLSRFPRLQQALSFLPGPRRTWPCNHPCRFHR